MIIAIVERRSDCLEIFCIGEYVSFVLETRMSMFCLLLFC